MISNKFKNKNSYKCSINILWFRNTNIINIGLKVIIKIKIKLPVKYLLRHRNLIQYLLLPKVFINC